jgi:DNA mismatch repair protein MutL
MNKIHQLPQEVISKIAAGEVIERPVYAVKELIENSLDAGADAIIITIEDSGLKRITVIDNGEGMSREDVDASFKPHTTSKLLTEEDLQQVQTLGFRGEALSSIAAISRLTIQSRRKGNASGTIIVIKDGKIIKTGDVGMPIGTQISVENLFHSVPARKKFLKSQRTEFRHIIDAVMHFAFSHPQVHFVLTHNGKTIFDLPKTEDKLTRINYLLGEDIYASLLPITYQDSYIKISGFLARPQITTKTPHKQYLFINSRKVLDKGISSSVKSAYGTLLEKQVYPVCLLFLSMPHEVVDVNVHPRKEEVRFVNQTQLYETIATAVGQTLAKHDLVFHNTLWEKSAYFEEETFKNSTDSYAGKLLKDQKLPWNLSQPLQIDSDKIVQMHNLYLLVQTPNGMVFIDQHAAHERIRYEQLLTEFQKKRKEDSIVSFPKAKVINLNASESELLQEHTETFAQLGFELDHFKGTSYLLRSVPKLFQDRDYTTFISEVLEDLSEGSGKKFDDVTQKIIAYIACHGAVKAGDVLTKKQSLDLIKQLEKTANNATCPHGRPTKVAIDLKSIDKMFKR